MVSGCGKKKFIAAHGAACSMITARRPVTLRLSGQSFFGRDSLTSTARIEYDADHDAIHIVEGGTTRCRPETDRSEQVGPIMYQGMSTVLAASRNFASSHRFAKGEHGEMQYEFEVPCDSNGVVLVWAMHDEYGDALKNAMSVLGRAVDREGEAPAEPRVRLDAARQEPRPPNARGLSRANCPVLLQSL